MDLATEILQDLKKEARRKQIVIYVLVGVIVLLLALGTIERASWDYSTVLVDAESGNANYIGQDDDIINGENSSTQKDSQTKQESETQN